jgi:hypothetical protein
MRGGALPGSAHDFDTASDGADGAGVGLASNHGSRRELLKKRAVLSKTSTMRGH